MATTGKKHCFSRYSSSSFLFVFIQFCAKRERERVIERKPLLYLLWMGSYFEEGLHPAYFIFIGRNAFMAVTVMIGLTIIYGKSLNLCAPNLVQ